LCDDGFEDFVSDGGEDALVVVLAEILSYFVSMIATDMKQCKVSHTW
jgi:hypothetical protein